MLRSGCQTVEAQCRIALFEHARALEPVQSAGKLDFVAVLDNHDAIGRHQVGRIKVFQYLEVLARSRRTADREK